MNASTRLPLAATDRGNMMEDPGAEDNRLTIDPNDPRWAKILASWHDGEQYNLANMKIQQMAPGDFRVLAFTAEPTAAAEEAPEPEEGEGVDGAQANDLNTKAGGAYPNPAVQGLMDEE